MIKGWLAYRILLKVAAGYRREGYKVVGDTSPTVGSADLILRRGNQVTFVEIKSRQLHEPSETFMDDRQHIENSGALDDRTQLDFVWQPITRLASRSLVAARIKAAEELQENYPEAAFLLAWAAFEAAALRVVSSYLDLPDQFRSGDLLAALADGEALSLAEINELSKAVMTRNALAHTPISGEPKVSEFGNRILDVTHRLNRSLESRAVELLDRILLSKAWDIREPALASRLERELELTSDSTSLDQTSLAINILRAVSEASS